MFIRSENLFVRPAWPEDRATLARLAVPSRHDPLRASDSPVGGLVVTMPGVRGPDAHGAKVIGTAGFEAARHEWQPRLWLAPSWRHLGLFAEAEDSLALLAAQLPPPNALPPVLVAA
ncbi:hypothetical protein [Croceicoccus naphthovorans]|uniref:hypothetical protein n=1 Tax=Croceicoccus naphthovorans TaxID=1348774 RepID=UPI000B28A889|nr:hypothetical protein [Croceicoccus naphthovorans]MBB3988740.1 hypothetical protein [Croceicoccus naphthovorans]